MSETNFIIAQKEDLKFLLYQWLDAHPISKANSFYEKPLSRAELAEFLEVSTVTITLWMKKGLPYRRLNGRVYFIKKEVMEYMRAFNTKDSSK